MKRQTLMLSLLIAVATGLLVSLVCFGASGWKNGSLWIMCGVGSAWTAGMIVWHFGVKRWHVMQRVKDLHVSDGEPGQLWPWQISQIFISHTLHNITALTLSNVDLARQTIEQLGELLRMAVEMYRQPFTLLTQEVRCAELFLNLEKIRLGRRLQVVKDVSADCLEHQVPSLFLLPLIENAIQYGIESAAAPSHVILSARKELGHLIIEISETASRPMEEGSLQKMMHDGRMRQLARQLQQLYSREQPIEFIALAPNGTRLSIMLPIS
ncbi:MAG TPA: histidine kinase [bacterium]|nr:histidine kinase [bacterium]HPN33565.1 histidine kinase [bacterium]